MKHSKLLKNAVTFISCAAMLLIPSQMVHAEEIQPEVTFEMLYPFFVSTNWNTFDTATQQGAILLLADEISEELGMETPKIIFDETINKYTLGQAMLDKNQVTEIRINANLIYDSENAIRVTAHELRHAWQSINCPWVFDNYISPQVNSRLYETQDAEVDAGQWENYEYLKFLVAMQQ